jgi:uncharacterized protein YjbJ (UPF0337 family)
MKTSTQDRVESQLHKAKGQVKETVGKLTNNPHLESEGIIEKAEGKTQEKVGQIKKVAGK